MTPPLDRPEVLARLDRLAARVDVIEALTVEVLVRVERNADATRYRAVARPPSVRGRTRRPRAR